MKVLMVVPVANEGGRARMSSFLVREVEILRDSGITVITHPLTSRNNVFVLWRCATDLQRLIRREAIDVVHIQTGTAAVILLLRYFDAPAVVTLGGSELLGYPSKGLAWWFRGVVASAITNLAVRRAQRLICVSENLFRKLAARLREKTSVIPRAVDTRVFTRGDKIAARLALGWSATKRYVVFSNPRRGTNVKNQALAEATIHRYNEFYADRIELEVIQGRTTAEVVLMLQAADALLVTSFHEGSPNIVKEALACELPIVSVACGDVAERITGLGGCTVAPYDEGSLALGLRRAFAHGALKDGVRTLRAQGLTDDGYASRLGAVYRSAIRPLVSVSGGAEHSSGASRT